VSASEECVECNCRYFSTPVRCPDEGCDKNQSVQCGVPHSGLCVSLTTIRPKCVVLWISVPVFKVSYELIAVLIILNFVSEESVGVANSLTLLPEISELNVAKLSSVKIVPYSVRYVIIPS